MTLKRITLQLARNPGLPAGDAGEGYTIVAPLTGTGQLDAAAWHAQRKACRVYRFHPDPAVSEDGWLAHKGTNWFFRYDEDAEGDDEPVFRLTSHTFREGEYITIDHPGGVAQTYKITDVSPV